MAVEKLTQTYEQLCLEKSEKENTLIKNVEITKKAQKEEEKVANCMKLVNNLLAQKDKLQKELTQGIFESLRFVEKYKIYIWI